MTTTPTINMRIDPATVEEQTAEFVRHRVAMQAQYMEQIWQTFDGSVRSIVPLFETEVRGVEMLDRVATVLFAPVPAQE